MFKTGEKQELKAVRRTEFGMYLSDPEDPEGNERILLPKKEVPEGLEPGGLLTVFIYRDSKDRLISTTAEPEVMLGGTALLKVKQVTKIGAFLDWGLPKDLLLPFHEQTRRVKEGEEVLAALYLDKSGRLAATMNVYPYLKKNSPYRIGDQVSGRVYLISQNFGVFVAVDDKYSALIPKREAQGHFTVGEVIEARITMVKEDGKLDLSPRKKAYLQIGDDAQLILKVIDEYEGVLPFSDKTTPEVIDREFGMSKAAFKRAVGHLLKEGKIRIGENRIYRI